MKSHYIWVVISEPKNPTEGEFFPQTVEGYFSSGDKALEFTTAPDRDPALNYMVEFHEVDRRAVAVV